MRSVDDARRALGMRLRELRDRSGLTGKELAVMLSWAPSKVSKLETGRQTPTGSDIKAWTLATNALAETESLLTSLNTLETQHAEWKRVLKGGLQAHQLELATQDETTTLYRVFEPAIVPGLLQTPEYARFRFSQAVAIHKVPEDVNQAVRARMRRQEILYQSDKRFHFILTEAALRYRLCPVDTMLAQLDRLVALSNLRGLRLGVIGFSARLVSDPRHGFWLLDSDRVRVETYSAELNLQQAHETALYSSIFERLSAVASYDSSARSLITGVMSELKRSTGNR